LADAISASNATWNAEPAATPFNAATKGFVDPQMHPYRFSHSLIQALAVAISICLVSLRSCPRRRRSPAPVRDHRALAFIPLERLELDAHRAMP
jgi:hypothetical protein